MIKGRQKQKGNQYEHTIAKRFSDWSKLEWIRTPASGAMASVTKSDIFCRSLMNTEKDVLFVECKKRMVIDIHSILDGKHELYGWLEKTRNSSNAENKIGFVIFAQNRKKDLITAPHPFDLYIDNWKYSILIPGYRIVLLNEFFERLEFKKVIEITNLIRGRKHVRLPEGQG